MKKIKLRLCMFAIVFALSILFVKYFYINLDFKYVNKYYNKEIIDDTYPVWSLISTEDELNKSKITDIKDLDLVNHNYITCQGGTIVKIKCNVYEYLFKDKKNVYVYVNKTEPHNVYIYEIKKINLKYDFLAPPTIILS